MKWNEYIITPLIQSVIGYFIWTFLFGEDYTVEPMGVVGIISLFYACFLLIQLMREIVAESIEQKRKEIKEEIIKELKDDASKGTSEVKE